MQARLSSPRVNNMADWMWVDLNQGKNRIHVRSKLPCTPEQTIRKRKGLSHKCCVAATCINRSCNWLLIPRVSFGSMDIKQRTKTWKSVWKGQMPILLRQEINFAVLDPSYWLISFSHGQKKKTKTSCLERKGWSPDVRHLKSLKKKWIPIREYGHYNRPPTLDKCIEEMKKGNERLFRRCDMNIWNSYIFFRLAFSSTA